MCRPTPSRGLRVRPLRGLYISTQTRLSHINHLSVRMPICSSSSHRAIDNPRTLAPRTLLRISHPADHHQHSFKQQEVEASLALTHALCRFLHNHHTSCRRPDQHHYRVCHAGMVVYLTGQHSSGCGRSRHDRCGSAYRSIFLVQIIDTANVFEGFR